MHERASLLQDEVAHYSTVPMVGSYAEAKLSAAQRAGFAERIAQHFAAWVEGLYDGLRHNRVQFGMVNGWLSLHAANVALCFAPNRLAVGQPLGELGYYLGQLAQLSDNATRGLLWLQEADAACQHLLDRGDPQGRPARANVLQALGDLKVRVADLAGARADYERALPIYRAIEDRLGEANTLQSLGNLLRAEQQFEAAFAAYAQALQIHTEIQAALSVAADLLQMGRTAQMAQSHTQALQLADQALNIYRQIEDRWGQALSLEDQAKALLSLEAYDAAIAAWWQAAGIFQAIGDESGVGEILGILQNIQSQVPPDVWSQWLAAVQADAEGLRSAAVAAILRAQSSDDPPQA